VRIPVVLVGSKTIEVLPPIKAFFSRLFRRKRFSLAFPEADLEGLREDLATRTGHEAKNLLDDFLLQQCGFDKKSVKAFYSGGELLHIDFRHILLFAVVALYRGRQLSAEDQLV